MYRIFEIKFLFLLCAYLLEEKSALSITDKADLANFLYSVRNGRCKGNNYFSEIGILFKILQLSLDRAASNVRARE